MGPCWPHERCYLRNQVKHDVDASKIVSGRYSRGLSYRVIKIILLVLSRRTVYALT